MTPDTLRALLAALHGLHQAPCANENFHIDLMSNYIPKITVRVAQEGHSRGVHSRSRTDTAYSRRRVDDGCRE